MSELSVYDGEEPDWTYCIISTTHEQFYTGFDVLEQLGVDVGSIIKMIAVNREEDLKREEKNRREDRELMERNRREDRELMERRMELMERRMEMNRREDIKRAEATNKLFEKLITSQNEILLDLKTIKKVQKS